MVKLTLRSWFPTLYDAAWRVKEFLKTGSFSRRWQHYYDANVEKSAWIYEPSPVLVSLKLPSHVDTILDLGCASGRNFIPFDGKLTLWGIDIVPFERIRWVRPFKNLTYEHVRVEDLTMRLEREHMDLSHMFVFENGTLMYVPGEWQNRFFNACRKRGCKNFMFIDYPPGTPGYPHDHFKIPEQFFKVSDHPSDTLLKVYTLMEQDGS